VYDPNALDVFEKNVRVISRVVIEEVDPLNPDLNDTGRNARHVSRAVHQL
jgi:PhoH-like ATPase